MELADGTNQKTRCPAMLRAIPDSLTRNNILLQHRNEGLTCHCGPPNGRGMRGKFVKGTREVSDNDVKMFLVSADIRLYHRPVFPHPLQLVILKAIFLSNICNKIIVIFYLLVAKLLKTKWSPCHL